MALLARKNSNDRLMVSRLRIPLELACEQAFGPAGNWPLVAKKNREPVHRLHSSFLGVLAKAKHFSGMSGG